MALRATSLILSSFLAATVLLSSVEAKHYPEIYLSKYIENGELAEAREHSADHMKQFHLKASTNDKLKSFSGYLTVDSKPDSYIFFWFFPALEKPETAPVVMWMSEATGFSSMKGVFLENGPFYIDEHNELRDRDVSWVNTHSMLYIDAPVGKGFSFTSGEDIYNKTVEQNANDVHKALSQFFTLFSEFQERDFYIAGELAAAALAPRIVTAIDINNKKKDTKTKINLKGLILGAPLFNMPLQLEFGNYFYNMGLVDEDERALILSKEKKIRTLIEQDKFEEAHKVLTSVVFYPNNLYSRFSGLNGSLSVTSSKAPREVRRFIRFADSKGFHEYLHDAFHVFPLKNWKVHAQLGGELIMSTDGTGMDNIMDMGYKVLIYAGQYDPIAVHPGVAEATEAINWKGAEKFKNAERKIWKVGGNVAGYVQETKGLTYVLVRKTGRYLMIDNPEWGLDLLNRFTSGDNS